MITRSIQAGPPRRIGRDEIVVCVLTGNGLKDPDTALRGAPPVLEAAATVEDVARALGW